MVARDIRARYTGSFLGIFWAFVHPCAQLLVFYFVFSLVLKARLGSEYADTNYAIWLISGMLPWMFFSEVVNRSPGAVVEQSNLIKKTVFPSEILSFAHVSVGLVNHFILFVILFGFLVVIDHSVSWKILFIPVYLVGIISFALGVAWILSALNVFLRDVGQMLGLILNVWFFFTPIIYPPNLVPAALRPWLTVNPMLHAVEGYRMALLGRTQPNLAGLLVLFLWGIGVFILGGFIFKRLKPAFADVL